MRTTSDELRARPARGHQCGRAVLLSAALLVAPVACGGAGPARSAASTTGAPAAGVAPSTTAPVVAKPAGTSAPDVDALAADVDATLADVDAALATVDKALRDAAAAGD